MAEFCGIPVLGALEVDGQDDPQGHHGCCQHVSQDEPLCNYSTANVGPGTIIHIYCISARLIF